MRVRLTTEDGITVYASNAAEAQDKVAAVRASREYRAVLRWTEPLRRATAFRLEATR